MARSILSVRLNSEDKKNFEEFCSRVGMNASVAVNMFIKAVINEQKLPFEIKSDPFYSPSNLKRLKKATGQLRSGNGVEHELIDAD